MNDLQPGLLAFVNDDVALLPSGLSDGERAQLVAVLTERRDAERLDRLGTSSDKTLAKAARKALHLLRTRGAAPKVVPPRVYRVAGPFAEPPPPSWASIIDGRGERVVWYVEPGDAGFGIFEVELSETHGVVSLTAVDVSRKAWRDQLRIMQSSDKALVGEISGVHARVLFERAYRQMVEERRVPPETYARFHMRLQPTADELAAPHPLRLRFGVANATDTELLAILDRPELSLLVPDRDAITALDAAIGEVVNGAATDKLVALDAALARVADESATPHVRARIAERLLELGLLVASRHPDDVESPRICLAAAERTLDAARPAHEHPTLLGMFSRLVPEALRQELASP